MQGSNSIPKRTIVKQKIPNVWCHSGLKLGSIQSASSLGSASFLLLLPLSRKRQISQAKQGKVTHNPNSQRVSGFKHMHSTHIFKTGITPRSGVGWTGRLGLTYIKAVVFPTVMYGCERWTIKKAESQRTDAFGLWCWSRLLRVPWTARRSTSPS